MKSLKLISALIIAMGLALSPMSAYAKHNGKKHAKHHQVMKHKAKKVKVAKTEIQAPVAAPAQ
ncbi:MAG: hypothetical protein RIR18_287 [Pseudomonadota bacterium]|jgi:hypothetical protein